MIIKIYIKHKNLSFKKNKTIVKIKKLSADAIIPSYAKAADVANEALTAFNI